MIWALSLSTTKLISRSLTPRYQVYGIRSLIGFGKLVGPLAHSVLYLHDSSPEASPKAISRRTSYLQVRLAFHRYPQVIPRFFNNGGFGPPRNFTSVSSCPWIGHLVSGLQHDTFPPSSDSVSLRLQTLKVLNLASYRNSPARSTKSTRSHFNVLPPVVNIGFQVLFHSPPGVLFTFPSRYFSTIGH